MRGAPLFAPLQRSKPIRQCFASAVANPVTASGHNPSRRNVTNGPMRADACEGPLRATEIRPLSTCHAPKHLWSVKARATTMRESRASSCHVQASPRQVDGRSRQAWRNVPLPTAPGCHGSVCRNHSLNDDLAAERMSCCGARSERGSHCDRNRDRATTV